MKRLKSKYKDKAGYLFDQKNATAKLRVFFEKEKPRLNSFGNTVNQTFEAYTFAATINWYKNNGWSVQIVNPKVKRKERFKLKFSTRGAPNNFSYAICEKNNERYHKYIRLNVSKNRYSIPEHPPDTTRTRNAASGFPALASNAFALIAALSVMVNNV